MGAKLKFRIWEIYGKSREDSKFRFLSGMHATKQEAENWLDLYPKNHGSQFQIKSKISFLADWVKSDHELLRKKFEVWQ